MQVELREHPAQAVSESQLPDGTREVVQLFHDDGTPVPLLPDQHGIYFRPDDEHKFVCVGYCLKAAGKPVCLIQHFPEAVSDYIHEECDKHRGGESRLSMISAPVEEVEEDDEEYEEPSSLILPDDIYDDDDTEKEDDQ